MCLYSIEWQCVDPKDIEWKIGYKVFSVRLGERYTPYYNTICLEKHMIDTKDAFLETEGETEYKIRYQTGFHIWDTEEAAKINNDFFRSMSAYNERFYVTKVRYRKITAIGQNKANISNSTYRCIVAREMEIIE